MKNLFILIIFIFIAVAALSNSEEQAQEMLKIAFGTMIVFFGGLYLLLTFLFRDKKDKNDKNDD